MKTTRSIEKTVSEPIEEYERLMSGAPIQNIRTEWFEVGDMIKKCTVYEEYTPVRTSDNSGE